MNAELQPIPGLLRAIPQLRSQAEWNRLKAQAPDTDPRIAHEADLAATDAEKEAGLMERHAASSAAIINAAELLIHDLRTSSHQSAQRTLAMRDFEQGVMRLRRELGDAPESTD